MVKKNEGFSSTTTIALIMIIFILGFGGTMWYYALYKVVYVQYYDITLNISDASVIGFSADATLHFGRVPNTGGFSKKEINLINDFDFPVLVNVKVKGPVSPFIAMNESDFVLAPKEVKHVIVFAIVPDNYNKTSDFTGMARIRYIRQ